MRDEYPAITAAGAQVVAIGNGQPWHARAFREDAQIPFPLWVDPEMRAYQAAGLRRSVLRTFSPRALAHATRALRSGFRQTKVQGDPWQHGGAFLITPQGHTLYHQVSREAGDHADIPTVLNTLRQHEAAST